MESIIERLVEKKDDLNFKQKVVVTEQIKDHMKYPFIEYMSYKLKRYGKKASGYLDALEEQVNKMGATISEIIKKEHFDIAVNKVTIGNLITSLKEINRIDFLEIFETINGTNEILKKDPANVYEKMDYKTKNYYREQIEKVSKKTKISEIYIAKTILSMAQKQQEELEKNKDNLSKTQYLKNKKKTHVGYFLLEDKNSLYKNLGTNLKELSKKQKANLYIQSNLGISLFLTILFSILMYYKTLNISVAIIVGLF